MLGHATRTNLIVYVRSLSADFVNVLTLTDILKEDLFIR